MERTIYFIYKNDKVFEPFLYAITDNKKYAKSFLKERKKSMFVCKEKYVSDKEYKDIFSKHSGYLLNRRGFLTKSYNNSLKGTEIAYLTTTNKEEMDVYLKADSVMQMLCKYTDNISYAFNNELLNALNTLHYFEILKFKEEKTSYIDDFLSCIHDIDMRSCFGDFKMDELSVFLYLYGNTIDEKNL